MGYSMGYDIQWGIIHIILISSNNISDILWIGFRENLQESPIFNGKIDGFRFRFSLKPIHGDMKWDSIINILHVW